MNLLDGNPVLIAGAGIAGLTAALAFASRGYAVHLYERAAQFGSIGAGIQLSPNATRILQRLDVLDLLLPNAVKPAAVVLRQAADLREIGRVPLGPAGEAHWGAPYVTCHRADLHAALLNAVLRQPTVTLFQNAIVTDFHLDPTRVSVGIGDATETVDGSLVIAADGVWSTIRSLAGEVGKSRFIGQLAWRLTVHADDPVVADLVGKETVVTAFLHPGFHLVAYPIQAGAAINLVAFTRGAPLAEGWSGTPDITVLRKAMRGAAPALSRLAESGDGWSAWPVHVADLDGAWVEPRGLALIGDAAHAMTPFAAQGAAMAIEDAETLAQAVSNVPDDRPQALNRWAVARRRRVLRVARRGALNEFAWHARGPVAMARNTVLKLRGPERLAADLDWLYGWRADPT